ncbi:MAG: UvrABC system protein B [Candidatus Magasanikbacteria bacterium GW2011_GWC2_42_27]|nr:MAG: UvrABC system protein B [Candidatus Magasanikbacteria bacterium GW2011_GWC2_42_27]
MKFKLHSQYKPAGDQPTAIQSLVSGIKKGDKRQTLLGVTGSGKTFTIANVIQEVQKPTLVIAHNKTLAAQLCNEFREFFPDNAVEYFVSYYDYYQPEAYIASSDTYIEKEAQINEEIDRLRHACTQALLTREDVIIVASVSAIYGLGSPTEYEKIVLHLEVGQRLDRRAVMQQLVEMQFERTNADIVRGSFRMRGQVFEMMPVNEEMIYRLEVGEEITRIEQIDPVTRKIRREQEDLWLFPAKHYVMSTESRERAIGRIESELHEQLGLFKKQEKVLEYERLKRRVAHDLELIKQVGYCNGIENYSRHFEGRDEGEPPFTLLDYFKYGSRSFLTIIDESHVSVPQIRAMYNGDRARKDSLVDNGFRLPSARDNRPLRFEEFDARIEDVVYVSATPSEYEKEISTNIAEQIVRPTGLIDPEVIIRPVTETDENPSQVDDVIERIQERITQKERTLVTTLTKRMAEDLTEYLQERGIKVKYLHSDILTIERIEIITALRKGEVDVIVGVNLLREGLDIPEVSLVAILDADKEGFLRSETSLIQTIGRAARNVNGQVILYADHMSRKTTCV